MGFLDDVVKSIPIIGNTTPNQTIPEDKDARIYHKCKFLPQLGTGEIPLNSSNDFTDLKIGNYTNLDKGIAGVKPSKGIIVKLFKTPDYSGDSLTISDDSKTCLKSNDDWFKKAKSVKIEKVEGFGIPTLSNFGRLFH